MRVPGMELRAIAIIDDDSTTRKVLQWVLERHGFAALEVNGAEQAVKVCSDPNFGIAALIADVRLRSAETGIDVAVAVQCACPHLPILVTSGTPPEGWTAHDFANFKELVRAGRTDFLGKPFTAQKLADTLTALVAGEPPTGVREMCDAAEVSRKRQQTESRAGASAAEQK